MCNGRPSRLSPARQVPLSIAALYGGNARQHTAMTAVIILREAGTVQADKPACREELAAAQQHWRKATSHSSAREQLFDQHASPPGGDVLTMNVCKARRSSAEKRQTIPKPTFWKSANTPRSCFLSLVADRRHP